MSALSLSLPSDDGAAAAAAPAASPTPTPSARYSALAADYNSLPTFPSRPSYRAFTSALSPRTQCVLADGARGGDRFAPSSVPIYQTATFVQPSAREFGPYDYTRSGNPTRTALEAQVAQLEGAHAAFAFASGMAALAAVTRLLAPGDELLVGADVYGGTHRLVSRVTAALHGVRVRFVDTSAGPDAVAAALTPATRMLHMETPSNPLMRISDVRALAALLRPRGVLLVVDSTMMPPVLARPLALGADVVVHSATKYFGGHSDVTGGLVCLRDPELAKRVAFFQNAEGTGCDPFSCWLFLRGIKTMALRVERAQENARAVAAYLARHAAVTRVFYPGLTSGGGGGGSGGGEDDAAQQRAQAAVHAGQAAGPGCVISFTTGAVDVSRRLIDALRIFKLTVSFGSVNSLCELPCTGSHASIPPELRKIPEDLVRLSVGIEDIDDLLHDLQQAFELATHPHVPNVRAVRRSDTDDGAAALGINDIVAATAAGEEITALRRSVAMLAAAADTAERAAAAARTTAVAGLTIAAVAAVFTALVVARRSR